MAYDPYDRGDNPWRMDIDRLDMPRARPAARPGAGRVAAQAPARKAKPKTTPASPRRPAGTPRRKSGPEITAPLLDSRSTEIAPLRSQPMISVIPDSCIIFVQATPAAPIPSTSTLRSSIGLPTIFSELNSAAITTTAVPCWSSWKTGMSSSAFRRSSISKQRGRRDVLEVDAAEGGRHQLHRLDDLLGVVGGEADREGVDLGELLEQHRLALHHRHRGLGADVARARAPRSRRRRRRRCSP